MGYWSPEAKKKHYQKNAEKYRAYSREYRLKNLENSKQSQKDSRRKRIDQVNILKQVPCTDCKQYFPTCVMQFDHVRGKKIADIAKLLAGSNKKLFVEIAKCDVVCANCHAIRTCLRDNRRPIEHTTKWWFVEDFKKDE